MISTNIKYRLVAAALAIFGSQTLSIGAIYPMAELKQNADDVKFIQFDEKSSVEPQLPSQSNLPLHSNTEAIIPCAAPSSMFAHRSNIKKQDQISDFTPLTLGKDYTFTMQIVNSKSTLNLASLPTNGFGIKRFY